MKLSLGEHYEWLQLRRVKRGGVTKGQDGALLDFGQPLGSYVVEVIGNLINDGLFDVGEPSPHDGRAPVRHTEAGASRYSELCRKQRRKPASHGSPR